MDMANPVPKPTAKPHRHFARALATWLPLALAALFVLSAVMLDTLAAAWPADARIDAPLPPPTRLDYDAASLGLRETFAHAYARYTKIDTDFYAYEIDLGAITAPRSGQDVMAYAPTLEMARLCSAALAARRLGRGAALIEVPQREWRSAHGRVAFVPAGAGPANFLHHAGFGNRQLLYLAADPAHVPLSFGGIVYNCGTPASTGLRAAR